MFEVSYKIPETEVIIEEGTQILIPTLALHTDPKYYDQPMKCMPERYMDPQTANRSFVDMPNLVFGEGYIELV